MKEKDLERVLKALANRRRLLIVNLLRKEKELSVGEISDAIKLSFRATSKHLQLLVSAEIVEREQRSIQMFYKINKDAPSLIRDLLKLLSSV